MAIEEGAIPEDAPKKDPNDPLQRLSRAEAMEAVLGTRKGTLAKDGVDEEPEVDLDAETQVDRQSNEPLVLSDEDLGKYLIRTKVNGEEKMVPLDQLRATAQKTEAADRFLAEAKAILADAKAKAATPATPVTPATTAAPEEPAPTGPDPFDVAVDSMFQGNDQDAKRNFREAVLKAIRDEVKRPEVPATPAPDMQQLANAIEQSIQVKSALRQFAKDYPDIVDDPKARRDADDFLMEITEGKPLEAFPPDKLNEILDETGKRMRSWFRERAGVPASSSQATTRDEKALRKEAIDELPSAATRAATSVPLPKTPSDIIGAMKDRRGQMFRDPTQT